MSFARLVIATAVALVPAFCAPLFVVVPNTQTSSLGNDSSGSLAGSIGDFEVQDLFGRSQFAVGGNLLITQLAYRLLPNTGSINATATSFALYMSTTTFAPNNFSGNTLMTTTFATNRGSDNTLVLSGGPGTLWSSPGCTGPGPCPFDMVFTLTTPYLYDRSKGFLLLDVQIAGYNGVGTGQFDVENFFGPNLVIAELFGSLGSSTGALEYSNNVTQFGYTLEAVPEPASYTLALCGLGVLAAIRRRSRPMRP